MYAFITFILVAILTVSASAVSVLIEGEAKLGETTPPCEIQNLTDYGLTTAEREWSGDEHLWWTATAKDETMEFYFTVPEDATYTMFVRLTKAIDYGMFQFMVDDNKIGDVIDCWSGGLEVFEVELGSLELTEGEHKFGVVVAGCNESATGYFCGIDYVEFVNGDRIKKAFPSILKAENPDLGVRYVTEEGHLVLEGEGMTIIEGTEAAKQDLGSLEDDTRTWSNKAHLFWTCRFPTATLLLGFNLDESAEYNVQAALTRAGDYGIFNIYIDDTLVFENVDTYVGGLDVIYVDSASPIQLDAGEHTVKLECVDLNVDSTGFFAGFDYLKFAKVEEPVVEEPVVEEPVVEEPVVEEPVVEEPVVEEIVVEEPVAEEPVVVAPQTADVFAILLTVMGISSAVSYFSRKRR